MKHIKTTLIIALITSFQMNAQSDSNLVNHYEAYRIQMQQQGDIQGIINAMTHLIVLQPNVYRKDTLAAIYMNEGKYKQALSLVGIEKSDSDTSISTEVKAYSLKAINEPARAIEFFEVLFKNNPTPNLAYELADLKIQIGDITSAALNITYGIANTSADMMKAYFESKPAYQVPLKAGFLYLKAISKFTENTESNHDASISILDEALQIAPNFNLANIAKEAILSQRDAKSSEE
jgi:tetratricopeptide (TPR) repeat protein